MASASAAAVEVERWFRTDEGRAALHRTLADRGLPHSLADDLRQDVLVELLGHAGPVERPIGLATRILRLRATDRLRSHRREPVSTLAPHVDAEPAEPADPGAGPDELPALADAEVDEVRRALAPTLPVRARSAALTAVAVAVDGVPPPRDCPVPGQGAAAADGPWWAGVWLAGGDDLWADDGAATRKRRSRRIQEARAALAAAAAPLGQVAP